MNRTIFLVTIALVLMLMLAPMALAQTPTPTPTPVAAELASGGNPAMLLPGAALLLGAGILTYAIVRRRR
jgi:predicted outer membrane protein